MNYQRLKVITCKDLEGEDKFIEKYSVHALAWGGGGVERMGLKMVYG